jgi:EmrB/QacA subfamily drug resistance transporter
MATDVQTQVQPPELDRRAKNVVFITIVLGMLLAALDQTIVSTSLPSIVGDLGGAGHVSWVVTSYLLAETLMTAIGGKLGDLFGRKAVFQTSVLVFIIGSAVSGAAQGLTWLVIARAVQGFGGGGLTVTATALIGDVIPLRERGRYQGALGAVFGVTTVLGPLLGGYLTDNFSWRWDFYVNVPIGIIVILLAARTLPSVRGPLRPLIDYAGIITIGIGSSALILATSWGGSTYPWASGPVIGLFVVAVVALIVFVRVELRAVEPVLPMRLFRSQVFSICCAMSFLVGFAMLGSITFLPTFLQYVHGVSATESGIRLLPLVIGLMGTALFSATVVSRTGRYKIFPVIGMPLMAVGFYLLSRLDEHSSTAVMSLSMFVVGLGIGLCMQVLTLVVQSIASYRDLGVSTSGVTFFRTIGSAFGTAVFGALYANFLTPRLTAALIASPSVPLGAVRSPSALHQLPDSEIQHIVHAYAVALDKVFIWAVPVALIGFVLALVLKEVPLRGAERAGATDLGESFAMPQAESSEQRLERVIANVIRRDRGRSLDDVMARADTELSQTALWGLLAVSVRRRVSDGAVPMGDIASAHRIPLGLIEPLYARLEERSLVAVDDHMLSLAPAGEAEIAAFVAALRQWLADQLAHWEAPPESDEIGAALDRIATRYIRDEENRRREIETVTADAA